MEPWLNQKIRRLNKSQMYKSCQCAFLKQYVKIWSMFLGSRKRVSLRHTSPY